MVVMIAKFQWTVCIFLVLYFYVLLIFIFIFTCAAMTWNCKISCLVTTRGCFIYHRHTIVKCPSLTPDCLASFASLHKVGTLGAISGAISLRQKSDIITCSFERWTQWVPRAAGCRCSCWRVMTATPATGGYTRTAALFFYLFRNLARVVEWVTAGPDER